MLHALAVAIAGVFGAQVSPALEISVGYAGPLEYREDICIQIPCGTATARGFALSAGTRVFTGEDLVQVGGTAHGTLVMEGGPAIAATANFMAAVRLGDSYFVELDLGGGYGWARRSPGWSNGSIGFAGAVETGIRAGSQFSFFFRTEGLVASPGMFGILFGLEWHPWFEEKAPR